LRNFAKIGEFAMERRKTHLAIIFIALAVSFLAPKAVLAHHGDAAYEPTKTLSLHATVTEFDWTNPHCEVRFDVNNGRGNVQHWTVRALGPLMLSRYGWTKESLKTGQMVTVVFRPAKDGEMTGVLDKVVLANGQELSGKL
jgi:hypothetical protein